MTTVVVLDRALPAKVSDWDNSSEPIVCEEHPERIMPADTSLFYADVFEPGVEPWQVMASRSGWTVGDSKSVLGFCPQCNKDAVFADKIERCQHCAQACERIGEDFVCANPDCFSKGS